MSSKTELTAYENKSLLRFTTSGSVDDGKSTLIGRLLYETNCIFEDQFAAVERTSQRRGDKRVDLALLLDGLAAEREQGITIDVAYRYFTTAKRKFIIADTPGHEQYTRNMVTGASTSQLAIILIDARHGVVTQSRRHGFLISLLQIPHLVVAVNKMDLVDYSEAAFRRIVEDYTEFSQKLDIHDISFIPISALDGDNVTTRSPNMPWYDGHTLLHMLENVQVSADKNYVDFRFPVQNVLRPNLDFRGFSGNVTSGTIRVGEEIATLPSGKISRIKSIVTYDGELEEAFAGQAVTLTLEDEIDISRGDMIVRRNNLPHVGNEFDVNLCWLDEQPMNPRTHYLLKHTTQKVKAYISGIHYRINVNTLHRETTDHFALNEIGRVTIKSSRPLFFDSYRVNQGTGSFILIDPLSNHTVAAGMIRGQPRDVKSVTHTRHAESLRSANVHWEGGMISRQSWEQRNGHKAAVIWCTGLSGAGKSTVAKGLISALFARQCQVMMLDGDNVRHGLCGDLGFSDQDRSENIRRVGETARLFYEQGNIVICTFISPFHDDRGFVRSILPQGAFHEVYIKCDLSVCKRRDPKGLYRRAEAGEIKEFTGIDSPYEEPENAEVVVETDIDSVESIVAQLEAYLLERG
ncbi:MAG: sulfate adenylyltransferase subunit CysN, partial [Gammaproteobacteria bacterium]|nr:sulfate adenylyltransferase subunit CysN [Gammaproteobacteria bacterium]